MLLLRTMINVKITNRTEKEDYVAVERETGAIALPSKHVFAIFSVGIISVLLALPFGQLIPENYSPFSALSAGRQEQNRRYEQAYLRMMNRLQKRILRSHQQQVLKKTTMMKLFLKLCLLMIQRMIHIQLNQLVQIRILSVRSSQLQTIS